MRPKPVESDEELDLVVASEEEQPAPEELNGLGVEDPLELDRAELVAELSEDPVRLYLREIGQSNCWMLHWNSAWRP